MLSVKEIKKSFGGAVVLDSVSLDVKSGQAVCIAGKNASGKTTLLNIIGGMLAADSGKVLCEKSPAFVPQEPAILPELSVEDNLKLWYAANDLPWRGFDEKLCEFMPRLFEHRKKRAGTLSGGMKKRLSIACALIKDADILLLDEPFAALDPESCQTLTQLLIRLKQSGKALLFTSHEPGHIAEVADELLILKNGALIKAAELVNIPNDERRQAVLQALFNE